MLRSTGFLLSWTGRRSGFLNNKKMFVKLFFIYMLLALTGHTCLFQAQGGCRGTRLICAIPALSTHHTGGVWELPQFRHNPVPLPSNELPKSYDFFWGRCFPWLSRVVLVFHSKGTDRISFLLPPNTKPHVPSLEGQVVSPKWKRPFFSFLCPTRLSMCINRTAPS